MVTFDSLLRTIFLEAAPQSRDLLASSFAKTRSSLGNIPCQKPASSVSVLSWCVLTRLVPKMKKIMLISDLYPSRQNSLQGVFVQHQAQELAQHYEVKVLAYEIGTRYRVENYEQDGIEICHVTYPALRNPFLSAFATFPASVLPAVRRAFARWKPDLIQVHDFRHVPELFWLKTWLDRVRIPKFLILHNIRTHPARLMGNRMLPFYRKTLRKALSCWDHVFTVNARLQKWLFPFLPKEKTSILGNAISPTIPCEEAELEPITKQFRAVSYKIISVGNLTPEKGFRHLIDAVAQLKQEGWEIQLFILGKGDERRDLEAKIKTMGLGENVKLAGGLENRLLRNLYRYFDVFVLPSYSETFGIVYLEAMYAGIPVIGTIGEGIHGLFEDEKEALFAKPQDVSDLTETIRSLMQDKQMADCISKAAQQRVKREFMLPDLISRLRKVYEQQ